MYYFKVPKTSSLGLEIKDVFQRATEANLACFEYVRSLFEPHCGEIQRVKPYTFCHGGGWKFWELEQEISDEYLKKIGFKRRKRDSTFHPHTEKTKQEVDALPKVTRDEVIETLGVDMRYTIPTQNGRVRFLEQEVTVRTKDDWYEVVFYVETEVPIPEKLSQYLIS